MAVNALSICWFEYIELRVSKIFAAGSEGAVRVLLSSVFVSLIEVVRCPVRVVDGVPARFAPGSEEVVKHDCSPKGNEESMPVWLRLFYDREDARHLHRVPRLAITSVVSSSI